jgi:hypothetical protein
MGLFDRWGRRQERLVARPYVLLRRERPIHWTRQDSAAWRQVLESETWKKLEAICEDIAIQNLLPKNGKVPDPDWIAAYTAGRMATLELLYNYGQVKREPAVVEEAEEAALAGEAAGVEMTTLQDAE